MGLPAETIEAEPPPMEYSEESDKYITEFLAGRNLFDITTRDLERRQEHDIKYQKYMKKEEDLLKKNKAIASKKYREEPYNKQSKCNSQFVNNLHTYKTCDGGSGYKGEQKHYAVDFVIDKNSVDKTDVTSNLKKLKTSSKNKTVVEWLSNQCTIPPPPIRRAVSCMNLAAESLRCEKNSSDSGGNRPFQRPEIAFIENLDPNLLPEGWREDYQIDITRLFHGISLALKQLSSHVNSQNHRIGELKIAKVLCSSEDGYAFVIPDGFDSKYALLQFSDRYEAWLKNPPKSPPKYDKTTGVDSKKTTGFYNYINVVLHLEEFKDEKTAYRRARHVCHIAPDFCSRRDLSRHDLPRRDLYLEIDTGKFRVVNATKETVHILPQQWANTPSAILKVRFKGAECAEDVAKHIRVIRESGRAKITSIDRVDRFNYSDSKQFFMRHWCTLDTAVLQTYKQYTKPKLTDLFCEDKDCRGMCSTEVYFKKPSQIDEKAPAFEKLEELRTQFEADVVLTETPNRSPLSAYILPVADAHQNEQIPEYYARLKFLSGFGGTDGFAVVTREKAVLWTDNQHFKIAQRQVDHRYWTVKNWNDRNMESMKDWIVSNLSEGDVVGFDPALVKYSFYLETSQHLKSNGIHLAALHRNLIDSFWNDRPFREGNAVKVMGLGEKTPAAKIEDLRKELRTRKCSATVVSSLEDVMWMLNICGNDLELKPFTFSFLFVTLEEAIVFIDLNKLDKVAQAHLDRSDVKFLSYRTICSFLTDWWEQQRIRAYQDHMIFLATDINCMIGRVFGEDHVMIDSSIVQKVKNMKEPVEIGGMRDCNLHHNVAIVEFLHWIQKEAKDGRRYTEVQLHEKIEQFKSSHEKYAGMSLPTVFSSGENSSNPKHVAISSHTVPHMQQFLLQSGGHYENGTTLVGRTVWDLESSGDKDGEFATKNTRLLKAHIGLASAQFLDSGIIGVKARAEKTLLDAGLEPNAGGHFLNVREMPDYEDIRDNAKIEAEQVITIESGYYKKDEYGIRISNCYETVLMQEKQLLELRALTYVPIETSNIIKKILEPEEILWLNMYHFRVYSRIGAILREQGKWQALEWLEEACLPI